MRHEEGNALKSQDNYEGLRALPLKSVEGGVFCFRQQRREKKGKRSAQDYIVIKERLGESIIGEKCLDLLAVQAFLVGRWLL